MDSLRLYYTSDSFWKEYVLYLTITIQGKYQNEFGVNSEVYSHESTKANYIINKPELKVLIQGLEDLSIFRGSIFNVLGYAIVNEDESFIEDLEDLFNPVFSDSIIPALLSIGDYGIKVGSTNLGERYFYGNKQDWYNILTFQGDKDFRRIITEFIRQYQENEANTIEEALCEVARDNLWGIGLLDWRYCLVKYPSTIKNTYGLTHPNLLFTTEYVYKYGVHRWHRMNGQTLNALHVVPEYIEVANQLKGKCSNKITGQNSDNMGGIIIETTPNGPIKIEIDEKGIPKLTADNKDILVNQAMEQFNNTDTSKLDRVEQLVLLSRIAIDVFSRKSLK